MSGCAKARAARARADMLREEALQWGKHWICILDSFIDAGDLFAKLAKDWGFTAPPIALPWSALDMMQDTISRLLSQADGLDRVATAADAESDKSEGRPRTDAFWRASLPADAAGDSLAAFHNGLELIRWLASNFEQMLERLERCQTRELAEAMRQTLTDLVAFSKHARHDLAASFEDQGPGESRH